MSNKIIVPRLDNLQRRNIARAEISKVDGIGKFMYLLHSPFIRRVYTPESEYWHSTIDAVNVLADSDNDPRKFWADTKKRLIKQDADMSEKIRHISFPLWNDQNNRFRASDAMMNSGLVILVFELHTATSNEIRHAIAGVFDRYKPQHHAQIIAELEREVGWAGTAIRLDMESAYEEGDYDNPIQPPGCPE